MRFRSKLFLLSLCIALAFAWGIANAYKHSVTARGTTSPPNTARIPTTPQVKGALTTEPVASGGNNQQANAGQIESVPNCTPATLAPSPVAPAISPSRPGLQEAPMITTTYAIYGNTLTQVKNQAYRCSPVMDGDHFSGNTSYALSWIFDYQGVGTGLCKVRNVSVGLSIAQQYPAWQSSANAAPGLATTWQSYMSSLTNHEIGHANIDRAYAAELQEVLSSFPATSCSEITAAVNAKAQSIVTALNAANEAYDSDTNHGTTQGASL